jgi:hypothetical protein
MLVYVICQAILVMFGGGKPLGVVVFFYLVAALFIGAISFIPLGEKLSPVQFIRAAYPIFMLILFYYVVDAQARILHTQPRDAFFNSFEKGLIGVYPTFALQRIMEIWLNNISSVLYCAGIVVPILALIVLYFNRDMRLFVNFIFAMSIGGTICLLMSTLIPVVGPYGALADLYYLGIYGDVVEYISFFVGHFSSAYGSFPAIYFCMVAIAAFYLWDFGKFFVILTFVIMTAVFWGGIYLRYHYLLDGLVALVIAFISVAISSFLYFRSKPDKPDFA